MRRAALVVVPALLALAAAACVPGFAPDAGPEPNVCTGEGVERSVELGHTGADFVAVDDGDVIPAWDRPQGAGLGTHINVALVGFASGTPFQSLRVDAFGEAGSSCSVDDDCGDREACDRGSCRLRVAGQTNVTFPIQCTAEGFLHVSELPLRFSNAVPSEELDGWAGEMRVTLTPRDGPPVEDSAMLEVKVGDFVEPSWWNN